MCNIPLSAHRCRMFRGWPKYRWFSWQQDVYSDAIGTTARNRLGRVAGGGLAMIADQIERAIARGSARVIAISKSFRDVLQRWARSAPYRSFPTGLRRPRCQLDPRQ